jgi:hypothetical protein
MTAWRGEPKYRALSWSLVLILLVSLFAATAHCTVTAKQPNGLGTLSYQTNPYIYEAVLDIAQADNVDGNLNLRVKPLGTYLLYDDMILLCGMPLDKFDGNDLPVLMTYERRSHHSVNGVGCHDLIRVDKITPTKGQF